MFHESLDPPAGKLMFDPTYELLRAARWRGYKWEEFDALEPDDQARVIAEYRIEMRYQAVDAWEHRAKASGHGNRRRTLARGRRG